MRKVLTIFCVIALAGTIPVGQSARACTTIIVGKGRTADGSVLIAHSEDDSGAVALHYLVHPSRPGGPYRLFTAGEVAEPRTTVSYMGPSVFDKAYIPGDYFGGVNAFQVAVYNNQSPGRLGTLNSQGGVIWTEFNELAMMKAKTAREAVELIGKLNETHGIHADPGTSFGVADPNEGWWIELAPGGQWAAQRVPDDGAQMIANCYRIGIIDFKDARHRNFLWSAGVIRYAQSMGWYDSSQGAFNFAAAYGLPSSLTASYNSLRHIMVQRYLEALPKVTVRDLMSIMRTHYEESEYDMNRTMPGRFPHHTPARTVCTSRTAASFVAQLRGWLPAPIGAVVWISSSSPCSSVFVPWYGGTSSFPPPYTTGTDRTHAGSAWWAFTDVASYVDAHYAATNSTVRSVFAPLEEREIAEQPVVDRVAAALWKHDRNLAIWYITTVSGNYGAEAYSLATSLLQRLADRE
jgi:dipeptidase